MKISVIIPVYNVEQYLGHCLDSVINQTYKNLEIICVNDASTDRSPLILEEYSKKDSRIVIVNNAKNSRLGPTRNHGMEYATGDYVHFLDSDDWLEPDAYERLVEIINKNGDIDLINFCYQSISIKNKRVNTRQFRKNKYLNKVFTLEDDGIFGLLEMWDRHAWSKLYRRKFLQDNSCIFNNYPCFEDIEFSFDVLIKAGSIYCCNDVLLNYRVSNPKSLIGNYHNHLDCAYKSYCTAVEMYKDSNKKIKKELIVLEYINFYNIIFSAFFENKISFEDLKNILKNIDISIFDEQTLKSSYFVHYNEIMHGNEFVFRIKVILRFIVRKCFPFLHQFLVKLRTYMRMH